jgi:hypothetical protein
MIIIQYHSLFSQIGIVDGGVEKPVVDDTIPFLFLQIGIVDGGIERSLAGPAGPADGSV